MKITRSFFPKLIGLFMILAAALFLTVSIPQTANAATKYFEGQNIKKVKISGKTIKITGRNRSLETYKLKPKRTHTFKVTSKTKYTNLVDSEMGTVKRISKSAALKKLKKKNFIAIYITYKKGGKIKEMHFGL